MNVVRAKPSQSSIVRHDDFSAVVVRGKNAPLVFPSSNSTSTFSDAAVTPNLAAPGSVFGTPAFRRGSSSTSDDPGLRVPLLSNFSAIAQNPRLSSALRLFGPQVPTTSTSETTDASGSNAVNAPVSSLFKTPSSVGLPKRRAKGSSSSPKDASGVMDIVTPGSTVDSFSSSPTSSGFRRPNLKRLSCRNPLGAMGSITTTPRTPRTNSSTRRESSCTPRTPRTSSSTSVDSSSHVVLALTEGRGYRRYDVGMATMDIKRPGLVLCQISDTPTYSSTMMKIAMFDPVEVIIPHTIADGLQSQQLFEVLKKNFRNVKITSANRRLFSDSQGSQKIQALCLPEYESIQLLFADKYFALAASSALLKYAEGVWNVIFASKSLKVDYQGAEHGTFVGRKTAEDLELVTNRISGDKKNTLFSAMNKCSSMIGARLLRANLLQPSNNIAVITQRLDCVEELVGDNNVLENIKRRLQSLPDVSQLLTLCMQAPTTTDLSASMESRFNQLLTLKTTLEAIPPVAVCLKNTNSSWFGKAQKVLDDPRILEMQRVISEVLHEDARFAKGSKNIMFQRTFAVKTGIDQLIDVTRQYFSQRIMDMEEYVKSLASKYNLPLRAHCNCTRGYHIQLSIPKKFQSKPIQLPSDFVQVQRTKSLISCTTEFMCVHNDRLNHLAHDIIELSDKILKPLVDDLRKHMGCLYRLTEVVAELDMILSLAVVSKAPTYTRPHFAEHLTITDGRNPILDLINSTELIPNDIFATENCNFKLITGPNTSGKSVYLRQVLLLQIMAQVGCFVPAKSATFRLSDRILSDLRFEDEICKDGGTLVTELREVALIFKTLTPSSIVALDEPCNGTSTQEGLPLAWGLAEALAQSSAFVFFTTHFQQLTKLSDVYPRLTNLSFEVTETPLQSGGKCFNYTHRLVPGATKVQDYGIRFAENSSLPESIVEEALQLCQRDNTTFEVPISSEGFASSREKLMWEITKQVERLYYMGELDRAKAEELMESYSAEMVLLNESDDVFKSPAHIDDDDDETIRLNECRNIPYLEYLDSPCLSYRDELNLSDEDGGDSETFELGNITDSPVSVRSASTVIFNNSSRVRIFDLNTDSERSSDEDSSDGEIVDSASPKTSFVHAVAAPYEFDRTVTPCPAWGLLPTFQNENRSLRPNFASPMRSPFHAGAAPLEINRTVTQSSAWGSPNFQDENQSLGQNFASPMRSPFHAGAAPLEINRTVTQSSAWGSLPNFQLGSNSRSVPYNEMPKPHSASSGFFSGTNTARSMSSNQSNRACGSLGLLQRVYWSPDDEMGSD